MNCHPRSRLRTSALCCGLLLVAQFAGCKRPERLSTGLDAAGLDAQQRRALLLQVVDEPRAIEECAILEGRAYRYFLKLCAKTTEGKLNDDEDKEAAYERLQEQPDLFRGHVVVCREAVIIEVSKNDPPPDPALAGCAVLSALLVNSARELFELRILCRPGSSLYEKLQAGIENEKNCVVQVTGYFFKNHAKLTNDPREPPWRRPLLVAPEPSFNKLGQTYNAWKDLVDSKTDKLLPSQPIKAAKAEERLIVEVCAGAAGPEVRVEGQVVSELTQGGLKQAAAEFAARLPVSQRDAPSAVIVRCRHAPASFLTQSANALHEAGFRRVFTKDENQALRSLPRK